MNPSVAVDDTSESLKVAELLNYFSEQDEETIKLKAAEKARQEAATKKAAQTKAKSEADALTKQLQKHAANIREGNPAYARNGNVTAKRKRDCGASLQVFSLSLTLTLNSDR